MREFTQNRRDFIKTVGAGAAALALTGNINSCGSPPAKRPNILYLMTDQHRYDFLGCTGGSFIKTPNFDKIAGDGVKFTNAYSSTPTCTPARAALLTGKAPWNHGMLGYGRIPEHYDFELPQALRDAGDKTAQMLDFEFIEALEYGMPPACGHGFSERLFSFLMDKPARECQIFPLMRPKKK